LERKVEPNKLGLLSFDVLSASPRDIFGYISSKTGWIRTKLSRGRGNGERVILKFFDEITAEAAEKGAKCQPF